MITPASNQRDAQRENSQRLIKQAIEEQWRYTVAELQGFRAAMRQAKDLDRPRRGQLARIYENILIDEHLQDTVTIRKDRVKSQRFSLVKAGTSERDQDATAMLQAPWFDEFIDFALDAIFWGYTLIELGASEGPALQDGELTGVNVLPRAHVVPDRREFLLRETSRHGIDYSQPPHWDFLVEAGRPEELGLLQYAVVPVVFKKRANAAWDEFIQVFGKPNVWASYDPSLSQEELSQIDKFLENMTHSGWGRFPQGTEMQSLGLGGGNGGSGADTFENRINQLEAGISKLVLQGTMITDQGSSRSQAEVHERANLDTRDKDMAWLKSIVNRKLMPRLAKLGMPVEGLEFRWEQDIQAAEASQLGEKESLSMKEKWEIDSGIVQAGYVLEPSYIEETYDVPVQRFQGRGGGGPPALSASSGDKGDDDDKHDQARPRLQRQWRGLRARARALLLFRPDGPHRHGHQHHDCGDHLHGASPELPDPDLGKLSEDEGRLLRRVWEQDADYDARLTQLTGRALSEAVGKGWRTQVPSLDFESKDHATLWNLEANVWKFSAGKSLAEVNQLNQLAADAKNFEDFRGKAGSVVRNFNDNHLRAEYNNAWISSRAAARLSEQQRLAEEGDFTLWEYQTAGDSRVRKEHADLDGIIQPHTSSFWSKFYPPNGWNCRCDIRTHDKDAIPSEKLEEDNARVKNNELPRPDKDFDRLPAQGGEVFQRNQQYVKELGLANRFGHKQNGLPGHADLTKRTASLDELRDDSFDAARAKSWFDENQTSGRVSLEDWQGRPMQLARSDFDKQVQRSSPGGRALAGYLPLLGEVVREPDEVFLQNSPGGDSERVVLYQYYNDMPIKVVARITDEGAQIIRWEPLDRKLGEDDFDKLVNSQRNGILMRNTNS